MIIKIPNYMFKCHYYWYVLRMLQRLNESGTIKLEKTNDKFMLCQFVSLIFIDGKPVIIDVRDDIDLPLTELRVYPEAVVLKSNYSTELWDNPPASFEYPIKDEDRKYRNNVRLFRHGRSYNIPLDANELNYFNHCIHPSQFKITSYTGAGVFGQQTESRIKVYDLISEVFGNQAKLIFYDRNDHYQKDWPDYINRRAKYLQTGNHSWDYEHYLRYLALGKYSLNFPGIAVSQPFRFVDGVLANRPVISTKIWTDAWKDFPCIELPICGYFGTGDWEKAKEILSSYKNLEFNDALTLEAMRSWYQKYLSAEGMWEFQFNKGNL